MLGVTDGKEGAWASRTHLQAAIDDESLPDELIPAHKQALANIEMLVNGLKDVEQPDQPRESDDTLDD